jgi:hypothetical protein
MSIKEYNKKFAIKTTISPPILLMSKSSVVVLVCCYYLLAANISELVTEKEGTTLSIHDNTFPSNSVLVIYFKIETAIAPIPPIKK